MSYSYKTQAFALLRRLVCVEGWSAIAWWAGLSFDDLLRSYPPMSPAKWARIESSVNRGRPVLCVTRSFDCSSSADPARDSPQRKALTVEHGAPLRLVVPVKLGLKNIKAITRITYTKDEPADYWAKRGYSRYDGI